MRLSFISDTHGLHDQAIIPECDVLIHAGDCMNYGNDIRELIAFNDWLCKQPAKHIICIAGNHDRLFESKRLLALSMMTRPIYLENNAITIDGVKFYGSPVQPAFMGWAFNVARGAAIKQYWDLIPSDVDVLITHGPPMGILDTVSPGAEHLGCEELAKAVNTKKPQVHVFGHIHGGAGKVHNETTRFINAAFLDERYRPANDPVVDIVEARVEK